MGFWTDLIVWVLMVIVIIIIVVIAITISLGWFGLKIWFAAEIIKGVFGL